MQQFHHNTHPWRRCFARFLDMTVIGLIITELLLLILKLLSPSTVELFTNLLSNPVSAGVVSFILYFPVEVFLLKWLGTTPGKQLYGIKITGMNNTPLTLKAIRKRTLLVGFWGFAFHIKLITVIAQTISYFQLTRIGTTRWDQLAQTEVHFIELPRAQEIASYLIPGLVILFLAQKIAAMTPA